jgi:perosamine synthetase
MPVFADVDPVTWCLSAESLEAWASPRTRAVIVVDLYGGVPDYDAVLEVTDRLGIAVVEDAAEAIGSEYHGRKAGSFGEAGVFSFHGSKTLTTGEGGMLVTNRQDLLDRVQVLRDHGRRPGDKEFWNAEVAYKYKMSSLQAALGLGQLERIEELLAQKDRIFSWYRDRLGDLPGLKLNATVAGTRNSYWMVTVIVDPTRGLSKEQIREALGSQGIDTRPFFHPLSSLPAYTPLAHARVARERNAVAYALSPFGVNLPSALNLTEDQVDHVCGTLKALLAT